MVLVIGAWCEGIGLALRLGVRQNLHSTGLYIAQYLFVVLSVSDTDTKIDFADNSPVHSLPVTISYLVDWYHTLMRPHTSSLSNQDGYLGLSSFPIVSHTK